MNSERPWHCLDASETARALAADPTNGLDAAEAARRLGENGPNRLPEPKGRSAWRRFLAQFESLLILVLIAAGIVAGFIGDTTDMAVIFVVVLFNACLGFIQESRAERIIEALSHMLPTQAHVRRGGVKIAVSAADLVAGDLVLIEAGDKVPADGRLLAAHNLEIDESTLSGESLAVAKRAQALDDRAAILAERANMAYMNTIVTRGRGEMLVTATGASTEMGRIAGLIARQPEAATPLQVRLDQLGRRLALIAAVVVTAILVMGLLRGEALGPMLLTAVALAVAAIPEGLPAVVAVTLAIGMARMARHGAVVRRLPAVETLGATTAIGTDKTGTLTLNQMTAIRLWAMGRMFEVEGIGYAPQGAIRATDNQPLPDLARTLAPALSCNDARLVEADGAWRVIGDPTEGALAVLAAKAGLHAPLPRLAEIPFDSASRFMATLHGTGEGGRILLVKGAPDVVLERCTHVLAADGPQPLDDKEAVQTAIAAMAGQSLRVIALAERRGDAALTASEPQGLTLLALTGLIDPPRAEAARAIAECHRAGIAVTMLTGDHLVTARAIATSLGLAGKTLNGADLEAMSDAELAAVIDEVAVLARVSPEHKVRIVQALAARGHVTAMTGDGVNDAAALKAADIGVAMGRGGTEIARQAAAMVLADDDFSTIVKAVREGRVIYDNIVSFVRFQLSTNIGALLTVFLAPLLGLAVPFHPIQILWVNIIMDGPPAMALAFDPPRLGVMERPPRPKNEAILSGGRFARLLAYGSIMAAGTLFVFMQALETAGMDTARTLAFTTFVLFQFFNVFNARVGHESALSARSFANAKLWVALGGVLALQVAAVHWGPAQAVFHTTDLEPGQWLLALGVASSVLVLDEIRKLVFRPGASGRAPAVRAAP